MTVAQDFFIQWDPSPTKLVRKYRVLVRESGGQFKLVGETYLPEFRLNDIEWSTYDVAVIAVGVNGVESAPTIVRHQVQGLDRNLLPITGLTLVDEPSATVFESQSPKVRWDPAEDAFVDRYAVTVRSLDQTKLFGPLFTVNTEYTIDYERLKLASLPRNFIIEVSALDKFGFESASSQLTVSNPSPTAPTSINFNSAIGSCNISAPLPEARDLGGFVVAVSPSPGFNPSTAVVYQGPQLSYVFVGDSLSEYYCRVAYYDTYKPGNYVWSGEFSFTTTGLTFKDMAPETPNLLDVLALAQTALQQKVDALGSIVQSLDQRVWLDVNRQEENQRLVSGDLSGSIRQVRQIASNLDAISVSLQTELIAARKGEVDLLAKVNKIDTAAINNETSIAQTQTELTAARKGAVDLLAKINSIDTAITTVDTVTAQTSNELSAARKGESSLLAKINSMDTATVNVSNSLVQTQNEISAARNGQVSLSARIAQVNTAATDAQTSAASAQSEITTARNGEASLSARIGTVSAAASTAQTTAATAQTEITAARSGQANLSARIAQVLQAQVDGDNTLAGQISQVAAISNAGTANGLIRFTAASGVAGVLAAVDIETSATGAAGSFNKSGMRLVVWNDGGTIRSQIQLSADRVVMLRNDGAATAIFDAVSGKILASAIQTTTLSAITANLGTVTAGLARDVNSKFIVDFNNARLDVYDDSNVLRVRLGKLS